MFLVIDAGAVTPRDVLENLVVVGYEWHEWVGLSLEMY